MSSIFGNFGQPSASTQQPPAFGASTAQPAAPTTGTTGAFGGGGGTSAFGSTTGGGLFGQTGTAQPAAGSSLFGGGGGSTTATGAQPTTSLFGAPSTSQQPATGSLFGGGGATTATQPTGSLFGGGQSTTGAAGTGGSSLFGGGTTGGTGTTGLFGQPSATTTQPAAGTSSLFGGGSTLGQPSTTTNPLFGGSTTQPTGSLFGSTAPKPAGSSLFGGTATGGAAPAFGASTTAGTNSLFASRPATTTTTTTLPQQQQAEANEQYAVLLQWIEGIHNAWNPNSPQCRFKHFFYNVVDPQEVPRYGRPPNADDTLWQKAQRENPDPSCHVPVLAVGFDDLQKRVEAQVQQAQAQQEKLKELKKHVEMLAQKHDSSNASRQQRAAAVHAQLAHRLIKLIRRLHPLIPALRSSSIRPEEDKLRAMLEEIEEDVRRVGGLGRMRGHLNQLWATIGALNAQLERDGRRGADGSVQWAVVDEEGLSQVAQVLADQQAGLAHLTKILQKDTRDLDTIAGAAVKEEVSYSTLPSSLNLSSSRR